MAALGMFIATIVVLAVVLALALPLLIVWGGISVLRSIAGGPRRPGGPVGDPAAEHLRVRLARGEISRTQFEQDMRDLGYEKVR